MYRRIPVTIVVCVEGGKSGIGRKGPYRLPWMGEQPEDLAWFTTQTTRFTRRPVVIMGRNTHVSIGRVLEDRVNVVLSRNPGFASEGVVVAHNFDDAFMAAYDASATHIYIIGGGEVYKQAVQDDRVDDLLVSELRRHYADRCDIYFHVPGNWREACSPSPYWAGEAHTVRHYMRPR